VSDVQCAATILVVRHGESEANVARRLSSAAPGEPLTARGRGQAAALAERLRGRRISYVYASPLLRAQQTGQVLAETLGVGLGTLDGVPEVSMGRCEGSDSAEDWAHVDGTFVRWLEGDLGAGVDGGETGHEAVARIRSALQEIADQHRGETVVVVSHGGVMSLALPRCTSDVADDYGLKRFVPNCGLVELSVDADGWSLRQWPSDPDRAPHPGDLIDLVGQAEARRAQLDAAAEIHGVPCTAYPLDTPWAVRATLTGQADVPAGIDDVLAWLEDRRPGSWQVRARVEQVELLRPRLVPVLELTVLLTDRPPHYTVPEGCEIEPARDLDEFLGVFGSELRPVVARVFGQPGHTALVLRVDGAAVGCARVTEAGGTAYVSGIAVRPEYRGRGLGRLISAAAVEHGVRAAGLAWLHCEEHLAPLYEQLGLRRLTTHVDLEPAAS
jgi:probable phosphoglycerate mutase